MVRRHEFTDEQFALLEPFLPPGGTVGHPWDDHRRILNGMGKIHLIQRCLEPIAQRRDVVGLFDHVEMLLGLGLHLPLLLAQALLLSCEIVMLPLQVRTSNDLGQIDVQQPRQLRLHLRQCVRHGLGATPLYRG